MDINYSSFCSKILLTLFTSLVIPAYAGDRLLGTGGVTQIEGSGGGGLVPWAFISGYGTDRQVGGSVNLTKLRTKNDYQIFQTGFTTGIMDKVEMSYSHLEFDLAKTVPGERIRMDTIGIKFKLIGDGVYDQDRWLPQMSAGMLVKHNKDFDLVPKLIGAKRSIGYDFYVSASKLYLGALWGRNILLNGSVLATKANQFGILGFGGDNANHYKIKPAISAAVMLTDNMLVGAEYRAKPDNLSAFEEESAKDVYLAWFPVKNFSITGAYLDLGNIADNANQTGWYISTQLSY